MESEIRRINVIIVEDNKELNDAIRNYLISQDRFNVAAACYDGIEGLKAIKENPADVVMLDIILPGLDGIKILEQYANIKGHKRPSFIMFTAVSAENLTRRALELGADYFVLKPFDLELLAKRIEQIYEYKNKKLQDAGVSDAVNTPAFSEPPHMFAANILRRIGISPNLKGYTYLKYAIGQGIDDKSLLDHMTKDFYPSIARQYNTTSSCVERALRHSIEKAWVKSGDKEMFRLLGYDHNDNKPTNSSFIRSIVELYESISRA